MAGEDALVAAKESRFVHQAQSVLESDAVQDEVQQVAAQVQQAATTVAESETFAAAKAAAKATAAKVLAAPKAGSPAPSGIDELRQQYDDAPTVSDPSPPEKAGKAGSRRGKS